MGRLSDERIYDHEYTKKINRKIKDADGNVIRTEEQEIKAKVWQRVPCGGRLPLDLREGRISLDPPDEENFGQWVFMAPVPEPSTLSLVALGLIGLQILRRTGTS